MAPSRFFYGPVYTRSVSSATSLQSSDDHRWYAEGLTVPGDLLSRDRHQETTGR